MISKKIINQENLLDNLLYIKEQAYDKDICVMVKADAYGHDMSKVCPLMEKYVNCFGVSNEEEAFSLREICKDKKIIVFGQCEDVELCCEKNIDMALFSFEQLKSIIKKCRQKNLMPKLHLNINTGMNRYGVQTEKELKKIVDAMSKVEWELAGVYTHFSSLTTDRDYSERQKMKFEHFVDILPRDWDFCVHVGGGGSLFEDMKCDMVRIGMLAYGYGNEHVKPVMSIESHVVDMQYVKAGEHVGYLCGFSAKKDMVVATIPLGYADGLPRLLSNKFFVKIKNKEVLSCGNICMDTFMVDVSNVNVKVGDKVGIMSNAEPLAQICHTTPYEVCTNFIKFRGETVLKK